ncbi:GGDEF domain-containing protein [Marinimicrobium alkaliphilum]|uniref:GGDEF domain-containing protein n=1 Tax=Marinimicrobium alkaliphilum TaxID=2202654 RepID=UPI000DBAA0ED|nr:GGDEF domain-containing protein [Marinimicrobium alkaliphilum]
MNVPVDVEGRRSILRVLLVITLLSAIFFSVFNWMVGLKLFALLEFAVACLWGGILSISKTTPNLQRWSLVYLISFLSLVLIGIWISKFRSGLYAWIFIFPILSYLLLGRRLGIVLTAFSVFIGLGALGARVWQQDMDVHWIVLGNFGLCALAIWAMAHVYEFKRETMVARLHEMATRDPLTGLLNRRTLIETLDLVLYRAKRRSEPVTFVYIDIDDFKLINDTQGHDRGDHILLTVAQAIRSGTRLEDYAFRPGGDEFFIIFTNCTKSQAKDIYARRIARELHKVEEGLSLSVGYVQADPGYELSPEQLMQQADQSMYAAKRAEKLKSQT